MRKRGMRLLKGRRQFAQFFPQPVAVANVQLLREELALPSNILRGYGWLAGSDQTLNGMKLIGKATLNIFEPGGHREIIAVEEKRPHVSHEHMSFK
jgi:hypothetical protein